MASRASFSVTATSNTVTLQQSNAAEIISVLAIEAVGGGCAIIEEKAKSILIP
jgi:hypothetical protein